jgi:hypothetical protein
MYHGLVGRMLVINSPAAIKTIYRMFKPLLPHHITEGV